MGNAVMSASTVDHSFQPPIRGSAQTRFAAADRHSDAPPGSADGEVDHTHDPAARSWVESAEGHADFPLQNLPLGIFTPTGDAAQAQPRGGIAIGDEILDLDALSQSGLLTGAAQQAALAAAGDALNPLLALGAGPRRELRRQVFALLLSGNPLRSRITAMLHRQAACRMELPATIGDYTDFYVGIHHATNVGRLFRPDNPLLPNYKHVPIGYHGRASSIDVSGAPIRRPLGQRRAPDADAPLFGPTQRLDYELEMGLWIGPGNGAGDAVAIGNATEHLAGLCLLNDWSSRDVQAWEYQPLGPFLAKNFATTISPWIVTAEALAPFRLPQQPRPDGDPQPMRYLWDSADQSAGAFAITLEAGLMTARMRAEGHAPHRLSRGSARDAMYWTAAQMIAHHTVNGCNLRPGDLLGTGTLSTADPGGFGSLLEISQGGAHPITLPTGETRSFLHDGDTLAITGRAEAEGRVAIGFGACTGTIIPARAH